jgi:hypothetical protein
MPTHGFEIAKLYITPCLNPFRDLFQIVLSWKLGKLRAIRVYNSQHSVVEIHPVKFVYLAHVVGVVSIDIGSNEVHIVLVLEDNVFENLQGEQCKFQAVFRKLLESRKLIRSDTLGNPTR